MIKIKKFKIDGLHCKSCKILIETEIDVLGGVKEVDVDFENSFCKIEFDDEKISMEKITKEIEKLGYKIKDDKNKSNQEEKKNEDDDTIKIPLSLVIVGGLVALFIFGYFLINRLGFLEIFAKLNDENVGYGLIFLIGILAGFHCIGMCGGLVITYTARHQAKEENKKKISFIPHFQYNFGRMISYVVIGGILGGFGSFFGINPLFTGIITITAGILMVLMGLSLFTNFKWLEKVKLRTPSFIARFLYNQKHSKKPKGPFIIGLLNGFMPCGPLQAMQLYALASGSISKGALSMGFYALGTIPMMFGFGSFLSFISKDRIKQIMKFSGLIVVILGVFMFNRGLTTFGYKISFITSLTNNEESVDVGDNEGFQVAEMEVSYKGYTPNVLYVKKGIPVRWVINVTQMSGCINEIIMPEYGIRKKLKYGENIIEFTPKEVGEVKFSCWMKMVWGKFIVTK